MGEGRLVTLGICVDQLAGYAFKSRFFGGEGDGIRLLRGDNVSPRRVRWSGARTYPTHLTNALDRYALQVGDVVVAMDRPWIDAGLKVAQVRESDLPALLVQRVTRLRARTGVEPGYLWALICSPGFTSHLRSETTGSAVPHISGSQIASFAFHLPVVEEQRAIASVLGALDDKIESNQRLANRSDEVWLAYGAHRSSGAPTRPVAELLADGVLMVNDGYRAKNSELAAHGIPFVRAGNLTAAGLDVSHADRVPPAVVAKAGIKISEPWDTAFTSKGTVGRMTLIQPGAIAGVYSPQVCFWRSLDAAALSPFVLHAWMRSGRFTAQIDAVKGQTDMADYVSLRDQRAMTIEIPDPDRQREIVSLAEPLALRAAALRAEARTLTALRDALIQKLVSGQIRVPLSDDPGEAIETAVDDLKPATAEC